VGGQTTPTAQRTVNRSGACVVSRKGAGRTLLRLHVGTVQDYGIVDAANYGGPRWHRRPSTAGTGILRTWDGSGLLCIIATGIWGSWVMRIVCRKNGEDGLRYDRELYGTAASKYLIWAGKNVYCGGSGCGAAPLF
jgi:hypothetical protein